MNMKSRNIEFTTQINRISKRLLILIIAIFLNNVVRSQITDPTITTLFQNSCKVIDAMRLPGGIYLDALALGGAGAKPAALNANGVGLISLCISDAMYKKTGDAINWDANAEGKALTTIKEWIRLKNTKGATNVNGLFHRYFEPSDGSWVWVTEHSTIDNAILAAGFLFCKNYFHNNSEIVSQTTILLNSMDFTAAIPQSGNQMYMILDDAGIGSALVKPYNEYMILAWFAKNSNSSFSGYARAQTYWNAVYNDANKLPKYSYPVGNPTLSEGNFIQPSFHVQFCFYYCNYFGNNADYMMYFNNMATADKSWWKNAVGQQTAWGCGAGEIPGGGYSADAVNSNSQRIVSPHIIAGFSPSVTDVKADLVALYAEGKGSGVYKIPGTNREFLWRYKLNQPTLRTSYVQSIDFSTMLYGLAALPEYLGAKFFTTYNDFNYQPTSASIGLKNENEQLKIYPNPISNQTDIEFELSVKSKVKLEIYSVNGEKIRTLIDGELLTGKHSISWNACKESDMPVEPGIYICRLLADNQPQLSKQILIVK
jgi:hypothetical protein